MTSTPIVVIVREYRTIEILNLQIKRSGPDSALSSCADRLAQRNLCLESTSATCTATIHARWRSLRSYKRCVRQGRKMVITWSVRMRMKLGPGLRSGRAGRGDEDGEGAPCIAK